MLRHRRRLCSVYLHCHWPRLHSLHHQLCIMTFDLLWPCDALLCPYLLPGTNPPTPPPQAKADALCITADAVGCQTFHILKPKVFVYSICRCIRTHKLIRFQSLVSILSGIVDVKEKRKKKKKKKKKKKRTYNLYDIDGMYFKLWILRERVPNRHRPCTHSVSVALCELFSFHRDPV